MKNSKSIRFIDELVKCNVELGGFIYLMNLQCEMDIAEQREAIETYKQLKNIK